MTAQLCPHCHLGQPLLRVGVLLSPPQRRGLRCGDSVRDATARVPRRRRAGSKHSRAGERHWGQSPTAPCSFAHPCHPQIAARPRGPWRELCRVPSTVPTLPVCAPEHHVLPWGDWGGGIVFKLLLFF